MELGTRRRGGDGKLIEDLIAELREQGSNPDTAVLFVLDRRQQATMLERIDIAEASEEYIGDVWGGGRFQVRLQEGSRYCGSVNVRVGAAPGAAASVLERSDGAPQQGGPQEPPSNAALVELARQLGELRETVADLRRAPSPSSSGELLGLSAELAKAMMAPMGSIMEAMAKARPQQGGDLDAFLKGLSVGRKLSAGEGGVQSFADLLLPMLDRLRVAPEGAGAPVPQLGAAHAPPPAPGAPSHRYLQAVAPYAPQLAALAASSADPGLWAAVLDERSPQLVDALRGMEAPDRDSLLDALVAHHPELGPHRPWLDQLVEAVAAADDAEP